ncbi:low temperature requirement protein A [Antrihabitans cavernicola]|uniref:Low temperature requirement protein A n=2 Tax=Antrihabitans cavernicola TaxID=2495913 RepID=A0A5A7S8B0_9NOCA|nr:low temperature requirement protein A [Spelaeibacter cavernicola]
MTGRDPHEAHRVATPLELLFDLTFVIAFGVAASELAHLLAEGHYFAGLSGFAFAVFATCWAWINFSWFASAYDTDDWIYRAATMVQMIGVIILALGIPQLYESIDQGEHVDNRIVVAGYVVMRVAMIFQWLRAAKQNPERRRACLTYAGAIGIAQLGWIGALVAHTSVPVTIVLVLLLASVEFAGPWIVERRKGETPWHAHHIAERYSLLAIIALGEGVVGTVASLSAVIGTQGWTTDAILVGIAGTGLTFGIWWVYFTVPVGEILHRHRDRSFFFGYIHIVIFAAIVATGAGLHVAAYYIEHEAHIGSVATVSSVAIPVGVYVATIFALYVSMVRVFDAFHTLLLVGTAAVLGIAVVLAASGVSMAVCLIVVMLAPLVTVVGYETIGHRHMAASLLEQNG